MVEHMEAYAPEKPALGPTKQRFSWHKDWMLLLTVPTVFAADQLSKHLIRTNMYVGESWPAEGLFRLTYGTNSGSAFGLFSSQTPLLILASLIAIGFLVYFYRTQALPRRLLRLAIGLQMGGALGNLIDRLRAGTVVDFIDVGPWPIFNLADTSIVVGMALLIGTLVLSGGGSQSSLQPDSDGPADSAGQ